MKIILLGNAGTGKSTMAKRLIAGTAIPCLSLNEIAWNDGPERKPLAESISPLMDFIQRHSQWVLEGCYSDLVAAALPHCSELRFLNPGVEVSIQHCWAGCGSTRVAMTSTALPATAPSSTVSAAPRESTGIPPATADGSYSSSATSLPVSRSS